MQRGRIAGAALDVFWAEPLPPGSPLLQLDNLTITGHLAGGTIDAFHNSGELLVNGVLDFLIHGKTKLVVNPESLSRRKVPGSQA